MVYLIGSLRNPEIPKLANRLRAAGINTFDDWFAAGPEADDKWRDYEKARGRTYEDALQGEAARNVYQFDRRHLEQADTVVLMLPAGKSGHLELGWALGKGKKGYILLDSPERWDVMYQFADGVFTSVERLLDRLQLDQVQAAPIRWHDVNDPTRGGTIARPNSNWSDPVNGPTATLKQASTKLETYDTCDCDFCQNFRRNRYGF